METIITSEFYDILYDEQAGILEVRWHPAVLDLSEDEYKNHLEEAYQHLFNYNVDKLLQNTEKTIYPVTENLQAWITENITKAIFEKAGLKKIAYIIPTEILTKFGLEQLVERAQKESPSIIRSFFSNYHEAIEWLKK